MSADHTQGNPGTAYLLSRIDDASLRSFVMAWDNLERMAIEAYRSQHQDLESEAQYLRLRSDLLEKHAGKETEFVPYLEAGLKPEVIHNPFRRILAVATLQELRGSWDVMRCFPQAREALNLYLLDRQNQNGDIADA